MVLRAMSGLVFPLLLVSSSLFAEALQVKPDHPQQYTVVKGDTLWDVSGRFLQHPWQWPQLWRNNPQIENPHWIYPGDTLYFSYVDGEPRLSLSPRIDADDTGEVRLTPTIRESAIERPVPMIAGELIAKFLSSPKVVGPGELEAAPYVLEIVGDRLVAGAGDRIYVRAIEHPTTLRYTVYRPGAPYINPETQEVLGYEADYVADASLQAEGDPATLTIVKSQSEIRRGDRLMTGDRAELAFNYFPKPPEQKILGNIIRVMGGVSHVGKRDIVVIDKGTADGLEVGHVLNILKRGRVVNDTIGLPGEAMQVRLPDELAGELLVFRPFERVSYALIMSTTGSIRVLDRVSSP
ncbi:MAG: LysM peptidoglycan-binding domain-containing protein [Methylomonas sp.]|nr:LysM peptidoglycan-binding domain-containing protein [Methylomonas sp.]PPD20059.1 MAG: peptidoglycan-binding protein [Methylomonas sp.]PPD26000.1 MAG: peptidoglycan-binding protein [Methylomonas sp.]PPD37729.1 MAG: peptidoglycan-binding protein [Methylomonas sp.]PPD39591.1 MAG: peptidoglycan-binding protein [Methylomonas sp.]